MPRDLDNAGFNLFFHTDWTRDTIAFQGVIFGAVDATKQYGMSQRGLAVDCGMPYPEECLDFAAFYLERLVAGSDKEAYCMRCLIRRESRQRSLVIIKEADTTVMDVDARRSTRASDRACRYGCAGHEKCFSAGKNRSARRRRLAAGDSADS